MFWKTDQFAWICDPVYHELVSLFNKELDICYKHKAYIACQVMIGSIVEATLVYALKRCRIPTPDNLPLSRLITIAQEKELLPQSECSLGQALRDYRNLIHPNKQITEKRTPTKESADLACKTYAYLLSVLENKTADYLPCSVVAYLESNGQKIPIHTVQFSLGRKEGNSYVVSSSNVSSQHLQIDYNKGSFYIVDKKSTNGTFLLEEVQNIQLKSEIPTQIFSGTSFRMGKNDDDPQFTFHIEGEARTVPE